MGPEWQVRQATEHDLGLVLHIALQSPSAPQWTPARYREMLTGTSHPAYKRTILVAAEREAVIGFAVVSAVCSVVPAEAELESIAVTPDRRGRGVGGALLDAGIFWAVSQAADRLRLEVRAGNTAALKLYAAKGFASVGLRRRYYAAPLEDAVCMERKVE